MARRQNSSDRQPNVSRRKFLAGTAVAGAAATTNATSGALAATGPDALAPERKPSAVRPERAGRGRRGRHAAHGAARRRRPRRLRLHGRRHQVARHRVPAVQPGLELPRHPRVADQLRRQQEPRVHHLHARGSGRGDVPRLLQDRRQAADDAGARHRRPAARHHGDLQRLVRPRAGHHASAAPISTPPPGRPACRPSTRRSTSTRWCATSPSGTTSRCRCSTSRSRSCAPTGSP